MLANRWQRVYNKREVKDFPIITLSNIKMTNTITIAGKLNSKVASTQKRFSLSRESYINSLPENKTLYAFEKEEIVAYAYTSRKGDPALMVFIGRSNKLSIHSAYFTEENRDKALSSAVTNIQSYQDRKEKRKEERSKPHTLKVGDIMVSSWGYDQTNIDYYQVTKLIGNTMVEIRSIKDTVVASHGTYQDVMPVKDLFVTPRFDGDTWKTETLRKKVNSSNVISINTYASAYKWDGKADTETHPMFGR